MQKDLKIGFILGLVLVASALLWLATRPSLSPMARMSRTPNTVPSQGNLGTPNDFSSNKANIADNQSPATGPKAEPLDSSQYEQTEKIKPQKFHIVREGETLSRISNKYYGSAGKWQKILDANRKTIKDPDRLIPGTKLIIPD
jgi:nucleoid-associated protein YgaU